MFVNPTNHFLFGAKAVIVLFLGIILIANSVEATSWTVSNNPLYQAQFNSLVAAQTAASTGDTLLIAGSPISYGNFLINKRLTLIGAGYNNPNGENTTMGELSTFNSSVSAGSKLMGMSLEIQRSNFGTATYKFIEFQFDRCRIRSTDFGNDAEKLVFINCLLEGEIGAINSNGLLQDSLIVNNCVLDSVYFKSVTDLTIRNSVFIGQNGDYSSSTFPPSFTVIENSIITSGNLDNCASCAFVNNIFDTGVVLDTSVSTILHSNNLYDTDPQFVNYPGGAFDFNHDYELQASSPGINAGSDGTDIGISGGAAPFEVGANPPIPQMIYLNLQQNSVPLNGTLQFDFKAKTQN